MINAKLDPLVEHALSSGLLHGDSNTSQAMGELLTMACDYSKIARGVIYNAISLNTKIYACNDLDYPGLYWHDNQSIYCHKNIFLFKKLINKVYSICVLVHELRHACQFSVFDRSKYKINLSNNWVNKLMRVGISEADAVAIHIASLYQLQKNLGLKDIDICNRFSQADQLFHRAFTKSYGEHKDILMALSEVALLWNDILGDIEKSSQVKAGCNHHNKDATLIHPMEWCKLININYKNMPYMNIKEVAKASLFLDIRDYNKIKQQLQKNDDSLDYFYVKIHNDNNYNPDNWALDLEYETIPAKKHFVF